MNAPKLPAALALTVAVLFPAGAESAASRVEFIARHEGKRLTGAEVCLFKAAEGPTPFDRIASPEQRCLSADQVIEIPDGTWGLRVRHARGYMSARPLTIKNVSPEPDRDVSSTAIVEMVAAGAVGISRVTRSLKADEWLALYLANAGTDRLPTLLPIPRSEQEILVPADTPVLLLKMRGGRPIAVSQPLRVAPSARLDVDALPSATSNRRTVVTWVEFPPEDRKPEENWRFLSAPIARLVTRDGESFSPEIPPGSGFSADGALLVFRDVPLEESRISVKGMSWSGDEIEIEGGGGGHVLTSSQGLTIRPAASVAVRWSIEGRAAEADGADCGSKPPEATEDETAQVAQLLTCESLRPDSAAEHIDVGRCKAVAAGATDLARRTATFTGIRPGVYLVLLRVPPFPAHRKVVDLAVGDEENVEVLLRTYQFHGRVTLGGSPVKARLEFRTGTAVSDETGRYYAALPADPRNLPVYVRDCDSGRLLYKHLPVTPVLENQPHDIPIPRNRVEVTVLDERKRPIPRAKVELGVVFDKDSDAGEFLGELQETDAQGKTAGENVPVDRDVIACASHDDFARACSSRFRLGSSTSSEHVTVNLVSRRVRKGRVIAPHSFEFGWVYFVTPGGHVSERAFMQRDGTFLYKEEHLDPEYIVIVSNAPLAVVPIPEPEEPGATLTIPYPAAPVLDLEVEIGPGHPHKDGRIGLFVGGRYVPVLAYSMHQDLRGLQTDVWDRGPLRIPSILLTAEPIAIALGPPPEVLPPGVPEGVDLFTLQAYARGFPRHSTTTSGRLRF